MIFVAPIIRFGNRTHGFHGAFEAGGIPWDNILACPSPRLIDPLATSMRQTTISCMALVPTGAAKTTDVMEPWPKRKCPKRGIGTGPWSSPGLGLQAPFKRGGLDSTWGHDGGIWKCPLAPSQIRSRLSDQEGDRFTNQNHLLMSLGRHNSRGRLHRLKAANGEMGVAAILSSGDYRREPDAKANASHRGYYISS